jgi:hypothetical protein
MGRLAVSDVHIDLNRAPFFIREEEYQAHRRTWRYRHRLRYRPLSRVERKPITNMTEVVRDSVISRDNKAAILISDNCLDIPYPSIS